MSEHNKNMTESYKNGLWFLFFLLYGITNLLHKEKRKMIKSINMHSIQKAKKQKDNRFLNKRRENEKLQLSEWKPRIHQQRPRLRVPYHTK